MIEIKNVSKKYWKSVKALDRIELTIKPGEIIGLFGENGAGKTTLMKSILGIQSFDGCILLDGEPITRKNISRLSFGTCEHSFFPTLTASENAAFFKVPDPIQPSAVLRSVRGSLFFRTFRSALSQPDWRRRRYRRPSFPRFRAPTPASAGVPGFLP